MNLQKSASSHQTTGPVKTELTCGMSRDKELEQRTGDHIKDLWNGRLLSVSNPLSIQPKLVISRPDDPYEQEADRVAERVMRMPEPAVQRKATCPFTHPGCQNEDEKTKEGLVRRKVSAHPAPGSGVPPIVHDVLQSPGEPLDAGTRAYFEPRFGFDFSHVRIHADARAGESARAVNARAYTWGNNIVFGERQYAAETGTGKSLIAHELIHVIQQNGNSRYIQRVPGMGKSPAPGPGSGSDVTGEALVLESEILSDSLYTTIPAAARGKVKAKALQILYKARRKPPGNSKGQRNYYLKKLKIAITTPSNAVETGKVEYGCTKENEEANRKAVNDALKSEESVLNPFSDLEEKMVATSRKKDIIPRVSKESGKVYYVDRSDPRNIRVHMRVKLSGKPEEVESIKKLEDAIEWESHTKGYWLNIEFVTYSRFDVFEFTTKFCEWANSGNWADKPTALSHEVHHALNLDDRYDYIEDHADNKDWTVLMRLNWFEVQMDKTTGPRDPYSKMAGSENPLLSEDVCEVAFPKASREFTKCVEARKDMDPAGIPPH